MNKGGRKKERTKQSKAKQSKNKEEQIDHRSFQDEKAPTKVFAAFNKISKLKKHLKKSTKDKLQLTTQ